MSGVGRQGRRRVRGSPVLHKRSAEGRGDARRRLLGLDSQGPQALQKTKRKSQPKAGRISARGIVTVRPRPGIPLAGSAGLGERSE